MEGNAEASTSSAQEFAILPARSARSCTECSRRKTKCDHAVPCSACVKRGQAQACSAPKKKTADPALELDARRTAALAEVKLFRTTLDTLLARLPSFEYYIANSTGGEETKLDEDLISHFGNPVTSMENLRRAVNEEERPSRLQRARSGVDEAEGQPERKKVKQDSVSGGEEMDMGVEAATDLEFMTLGRPRNVSSAQNGAQVHNDPYSGEPAPFAGPLASILASRNTPPSPMTTYPDGASLLAVAPTRLEEEVIFAQGLEMFGWHHSVVHASTFYKQQAAFWELGQERFHLAAPAWLSLYFALLAVSTKLIDSTQQDRLGWTEETTGANANKWFECSIANMYRANFLQNHDFFTLQAIALLVLSGRDAGSASLIANLLSSGLSIAQDLNLHRQASDAAWEASVRGKSVEERSRLLVDREVKKRVLWALAHSDWFAIPFRSSWILGRGRISTPLPLNATDDDLLTGELINRPTREFTNASWLLQYVELGSCMQVAFEHSTRDRDAAPDYDAFLKVDTQLEALLATIPPWLRDDGDATGLPACYQIMRSTFVISAQHKILSIHRPFLAKRNKAYNFSRRRVVIAARVILREGARIRDNRLWTVLYHLSVAIFSITLELFEQLKHPTAEADPMRAEVYAALSTLEGLRKASSIADRGLVLVLPLLEEERRLKEDVDSKRATSRKAKTAASTSTSAQSASPSFPISPPDQSLSTPTTYPLPSTGHMPTPQDYSSLNLAMFDPSFGTGSDGLPSTQPSPDTFPSWFFGEAWLSSQLDADGAPIAGGFAAAEASAPQWGANGGWNM